MTDAPDDLPLEELERRITGAAVRLAAATAQWLALIAQFDRREGWGGHGLRSCAHWLAWQCGLSPGAAREHVRVARALTGLPGIRDAFAAGRLSYSKVRALTRVAEPDTEAALLDLAHEATAAQVERVVRAWRRSDAVDAGTVRDRRRFEHWWDDDGMLHVRMCLDADEGAAFLAGVDSLAERDARRERAAARREAAGPAGDPEPGGSADEMADEVADEWPAPGSGARPAGVLPSPGWPPPHRRPTAGPVTRRDARSSCTSTPRSSPTTPRRAGRTWRAGRHSTAARSGGCSARPRW